MANAARCNGQRSALRWQMQRDAFSCPLSQAIPSKAHSFLLLPTPPLRSPNPLIVIGSLLRTCQPTFPLSPARLTSFRNPYSFHSQRTRFPQQAHLSSSTRHLSSSAKALAPTLPERLPSPANTIVFHNQNVRLPLPKRSFSSASTFGFSCQNPRNPQPTESYSQPTGSPASTHAARAAR